jgi:hypothetical protein
MPPSATAPKSVPSNIPKPTASVTPAPQPKPAEKWTTPATPKPADKYINTPQPKPSKSKEGCFGPNGIKPEMIIRKDPSKTDKKPESKPKPDGQTANGQPTDKYGNKLGPSGRPMVHNVDYPTRNRAKDGAKNVSPGGTPVEHSNPVKGKPHFHPGDKDGNKKPGSAHHNYP